MSLDELKYVIVERHRLKVAIIGSPLLTHRELVPTASKVVSAGFCKFIPGDELNVAAYGCSVTLNIESHPEDSRIILDTITGMRNARN